MARGGVFSSLDTTQTPFFQSDRDAKKNSRSTSTNGGALIGTPSDGRPAKGFFVASDIANTTNVVVYINQILVGYVAPGRSQDFISVHTDRSANGDRLELKASSSTVSGTFGTIDG